MEVTSATTTTTAAATTAETDSALISSDFETFLKMMTTQLQNQDPLDPMSSENFATQLATFSGVEQQVKTNDLLTSLATQMSTMGMSQFASWIGLEAKAEVAGQFDGSPIDISPTVASGADSAVLVVYDSNGAEAQRLTFDTTAAELEWAGVDDNGDPLDSGLYTFAVESYSGEDLLETSTPAIYAEIVEAKNVDGTTVLVFEGGAEVAASDVSAVRS